MQRNKKLRYYLATLLLLPAGAFGQAIRGSIPTQTPNKETRLKIERPKATTSKASAGSAKKEPEYMLYRNVVRKNSWLTGQGEPITQAEADKLPYYFRLSMKNDKGHYQFVEAMKGNRLTTEHPVTPYILDKENHPEIESESNREWREKIGRVGQWLLTPDLSGENMVEERAYEAVEGEANLIYVFQPVKTGENRVIAGYLNDWGLPVDINDSTDDHYYGNVVQIQYNPDGTDAVVDFLDGRGLRRYNEFRVDQIRFVYDDKGRIAEITNHNVVGTPMKDAAGNYGVKIIYDTAGNLVSKEPIDKR